MTYCAFDHPDPLAEAYQRTRARTRQQQRRAAWNHAAFEGIVPYGTGGDRADE